MVLVEQSISALLEQTFQPKHMELTNESHMHSVPPNSETHFKLVLVAEQFDGLSKVKRQQSVYATLAEYMNNPVHALAMHTYSPNEWSDTVKVADSPDCLGGSKAD